MPSAKWTFLSACLDVAVVPVFWLVALLVLCKLVDFLVVAFCSSRTLDRYLAADTTWWALYGFLVVCNLCYVLYHATSPRPRAAKIGARPRP